jgi:hypothetical protein
VETGFQAPPGTYIENDKLCFMEGAYTLYKRYEYGANKHFFDEACLYVCVWHVSVSDIDTTLIHIITLCYVIFSNYYQCGRCQCLCRVLCACMCLCFVEFDWWMLLDLCFLYFLLEWIFNLLHEFCLVLIRFVPLLVLDLLSNASF